jgi:hypothetical protein
MQDVQSLPTLQLGQTGSVFAAACQLCVIAQDVVMAFYTKSEIPIAQRVPLSFVESKYRELLAWSETLPFELIRDNEQGPDVLVLQ